MRNRVACKLRLIRALSLAAAAIALASPAVCLTASSIGTGEARPLSFQTPQLRGPRPRTAPSEVTTTTRIPEMVLQWPQPIPAITPVPPGYSVGEIKVTGTRFLKREFLQPMLGLVSGKDFDGVRLRKGLEDIRRLYSSLGYIHLTPVPAFDFDNQRKLVNLILDIDEGRQFSISRISFTGNTTTPDEVIRREIAIKEGYVFNSLELENSMKRLNRLKILEPIRIEDFSLEPVPNEAKVDIVLRVKEKAR